MGRRREENIGGYDKNYKYDRRAVNYLENVLLKSDLLIPQFESGGKTPNLDGYIELCEPAEKKIIPIGRFDVQIKSLNRDYRNHNSHKNTEHLYKYSCDTKVINAVLRKQICNPVLLILVDSGNRHIFWKYLSIQYCLELNVETKLNKTIYFDRADELEDPDQWYAVLYEIYRRFSYEQRRREENWLLPAGREREVPIVVQEISDYINHILDNELWFIKQAYFQDTWKIGIAYSDGGGNAFSYLGLYKIKKGKNDLFIKAFKETSDYFHWVRYIGRNDLKDIIKGILKSWIDNFFSRDSCCAFLYPDAAPGELSVRRFEAFFMENKEKFGSRSEKVFEQSDTHVIVIDEDERDYVYGVKRSKQFSIECYLRSENEQLYNEILDSIQPMPSKYREIGLGVIEAGYSRYELWKRLNKALFLNYVKEEYDRSTVADYISRIFR